MAELIAAWFAGFASCLAFWGIWGWLVVVGILWGLSSTVEKEAVGGSVLITLLLIAFLFLFVGLNPFVLIRDYWFVAIFLFAAYFAVGASWSVFKWRRLVRSLVTDLNEQLKKFSNEWVKRLSSDDWINLLPPSDFSDLKEKNQNTSIRRLDSEEKSVQDLRKHLSSSFELKVVPDAFLSTWRSSLPQSLRRKPTPQAHADKLTIWIAFWPISLINYALFRFVRDVAEFVWRRLVKIYRAIVDKLYAGVDERLLDRND